MITVVFDTTPSPAFNVDNDLELFAAEDSDPGHLDIVPVEFFAGVPQYYLLQIRNPLNPLVSQVNGHDITGPRPAAGGYSIHFDNDVGRTVDVAVEKVDDFTIRSVNLANQPAAIPLGNFIDPAPPGVPSADFIGAVREDLTTEQSVAYLYLGGPSPTDFGIDASTPALKLPGLLLSPDGARHAIFSSPGDYNKDGRADLAVLVTRQPGAGVPPVAKEGVYILFGRPTPWVGELDLVASADVVITGLSGAGSVANAGDLNGDAIDDLVVGDRGAGFAAVILGRTSANWANTARSPLVADFSNGAAPSLDGFVIDNTVPVGSPAGQVPGLWHQSTRRTGEAGHSSPHSLYFGIEAAGNYNVGLTSGRVTSPVINLAGVSGAELSFSQVLRTEVSTAFDQAEVQISVDGVTFTTVMSRANGLLPNSSAWTNATFNLQSFLGQSIRIRFAFNTVDPGNNQFEGWYLDDVIVRTFYNVANPDVKLTGPPGTGASVAGVGDINNDGRPDLAVLRAGTGSDGRISFVFGHASSSPFPATAAIDSLPGTSVITNNFDLTNFSVRPAGNVDGEPGQEVLVSGDSTSYLLRAATLVGTPQLTTVGLLIPAGGVVSLGSVNNDAFADLGASAFEDSSPLSGPSSSDRLHQVEWVFLGGPTAGLKFDRPAIVLEPEGPDYVSAGPQRLRPFAIAGIFSGPEAENVAVGLIAAHAMPAGIPCNP